MLPMLAETLRLKIRRVRTADVRSFVPIEAQPAKPFDDAGDHVPRRALGIGVFDPEHEGAVMTTSEQPVEERRACATDMQVARGRRREADPDHLPIVTS